MSEQLLASGWQPAATVPDDADEIVTRAARDKADQFHFGRGSGDDAQGYERDFARFKADFAARLGSAPHTVTTIAELDALPVGSVIRTRQHTVWEVYDQDDFIDGYKFRSTMGEGRFMGKTFEGFDELPAAVLYVPSAGVATEPTGAEGVESA